MNTNTQLKEFSQYMSATGYSQSTIAGMIKTLKKFLHWIETGQIQIETLNYNDITAYIQDVKQRSITNQSIQHLIIHIKHYINYLIKCEIMPYNPALSLKIKNGKRRILYNVLSKEELETIYKSYQIELPHNPKAPPQTINKLARKRNKVLLGLIIYQGIAAEDIKKIELSHLELKEGIITIPGRRRSNERKLKLEANQIFDLYDYINDTRKAILAATKKETKQLFVSVGSSYNIQNILQKLVQELRIHNPVLKNLDHIRASVISNWLKTNNTRKTQHMAGHRYVSSTESYKANNIDDLQKEVEKYYPSI